MRKLLLSFAMCLMAGVLFAQTGKPTKVIYGQLFGPFSSLSIGYDARIASHPKWGWKVELGYGFAQFYQSIIGNSISSEHFLSLPVGFNYLTGTGNHHCELGAAWRNGIDYYHGKVSGMDYYEDKDKGGVVFVPNDAKTVKYSVTAGFQDVELNVGYRYQKPRGFNFRIGVALVVASYYGKYYNGFGKGFSPYASFGYSF